MCYVFCTCTKKRYPCLKLYHVCAETTTHQPRILTHFLHNPFAIVFYCDTKHITRSLSNILYSYPQWAASALAGQGTSSSSGASGITGTGGAQGGRCPGHHVATSLEPTCEATPLTGEHPCGALAGGGTGKGQGNVANSLGQKAQGNGHLRNQMSGGSTTGLLGKGELNGQVGSRGYAVEAK